jgi:hypothetical protein
LVPPEPTGDQPVRSGPLFSALRVLGEGAPPKTLGEIETRALRLLAGYEILADAVDARFEAAIEHAEFGARCANESLVLAARHLGVSEGLGLSGPRKTLPDGMSQWVTAEQVTEAVGCSLSKAKEYLRAAAGRTNGTGKQLRVPVDVWEEWARENLFGQQKPTRLGRASTKRTEKQRQLRPAERGESTRPLLPVLRRSSGG